MNKDMCVQAYNDSTEAVARLASFCTSDYIKKIGSGYYQSRASTLASRDMILMCISLRRLAELTSQQTVLRQDQIHAFVPKLRGSRLEIADSGQSYSAWDVIGNVVHARLLEIVTDDAQLKHLLSMTKDFDSLWQAIENKRQIEPVCFIQSDKGTKGFRSLHLIRTAVKFLEEIEDVLADNKIFVGEGFD